MRREPRSPEPRAIAARTSQFVLGLALVLTCLNCAVTIDEGGISATNLLRRRFFQARWSEITSLERIESRPGSGYKLRANGKTLKIQLSAVEMKDLVSQIERQTNLAKGTS
jgi:hypothetical protein